MDTAFPRAGYWPREQAILFDSPPCANVFVPQQHSEAMAELRAAVAVLDRVRANGSHGDAPSERAALVRLERAARGVCLATPDRAPVVPGMAPRFNGPEFDPARDTVRLNGQLLRIWGVVKDGLWRTLSEIAVATDDPITSISAQLRHLRKARFGAHRVDREHLGNGLYRYRVIVNPEARVGAVGEAL